MDVDDDKLGDLLFVGHDSTRMYSGSPIGLFFSSDLGHEFTRAAGVLGRLHITTLESATANDHVIIYAATTGGEVHTGAASFAAAGPRSAAATAGVFVGGGCVSLDGCDLEGDTPPGRPHVGRSRDSVTPLPPSAS